MSVLLGFYLGVHDSNISVAIDGEVKYAKSERITGIKHHKASIEFVSEMCREWELPPIDVVAFSDGNRNDLGVCDVGKMWQEVRPIRGLANVPTFCLDHHYCHILSAWPLISLGDIDKGFAIDGRGDHDIRRTVLINPGSLSPTVAYSDPNRSLGSFLCIVGRQMGLRATCRWDVDLAGKVMGAQAYGRADDDYINSFDLQDIGTHYPDLIDKIKWRGQFPAETPDFFNFSNPSFRDWLSSVHKIIELETNLYFQTHAEKSDKLVYSGGCAQNVVCNDNLKKIFDNLTIPPHCYDGGLSLGAIEFLRMLYKQPTFSNNGFPYWQHDVEKDVPSSHTIKLTAEKLAQNKIVGWFQGRGEIGPRALGNRSILMNPTVPDGKDILNSKVKHREMWRPFAASILQDYTSSWFDINDESPYMLRSVKALDSKKTIIPAVTHIDGTCRIQTVNQKQTSIFTELITEFYKLTGIPMLLNTSLNGLGQPMYSTKQQCIDLMASSDLDVLVVGDSMNEKS